MNRNIILMMLLVTCGATGVTVATDQDEAAPAASERPLSDLVQQVKSWYSPVDVKEEIKRRIETMAELSKENMDALVGVARGAPDESLSSTAKAKIKELCMNILTSNQLGQLLRDAATGSDQTLARQKVEMLFTYCDVNITQANLVELAPSMKEFQDHVLAADPAANAVNECYYSHYKKYDLRDYYSVWQKKPAEELKAELKILQDIIEDHTVYTWVKWFYDNVQKDLINEIILKEPSFYDDPMIESQKSNISVKAKKAVDAAKASAKEEESKTRKTLPMMDLVNEFEKKYGTHKYADAETAFKEKEMSERENLKKDYQNKSFDDLKAWHKSLCAEKKKYGKSADPHGLYRLRNHWIKMQQEEAETALLEKLNGLKPEDYQALYDDNYDDNLGFSNKIYSAFEKVTDKIKADLVQTYQNMSDAERSKLEKKWGKEKYSTNRMKGLISRVTLEALEKVKKNQAKNVTSGQVVLPSETPQGVFSFVDEKESDIDLWSVEDLTDYLKKILGKKWEKGIDQVLKDGEGLSDKIVETKKQSIFKALLKLTPSAVSKKLKTETKYSVLRQFIHSAYSDDEEFKRNEHRVYNQVIIDLRIIPLGLFSESLSDMCEKNADLEELMQDRQEMLNRVILKVHEPHTIKELKKEIVLAYLRKIGGFVQFFKEETDVLDEMKVEAKNAKMTSTVIQDMIKISGMNNMDKDDEGYSDYSAVNDFAQLLSKEGRKGANKKENRGRYSGKRKSKPAKSIPAA